MAQHVHESIRELTHRTVSLQAVARLIRIEYCLLGALGVAAGGLLVRPSTPDVTVVRSALAVFFVAAGCYSLDDYFDRKTDAANLRSDRPLVRGSSSAPIAAAVGMASFALAGVFAALAAPSTVLFIAAGAIAAMVYNRWLQGVPVVKNALLAGAFPAPILIGGFSAGGPTSIVWYSAVVAYVLGLGFEIMIDIGDIEGDRATGVVTLSTSHGIGLASRVSAVFLITGAVIAVLPFVLPLDDRLQWDLTYVLLVGGAGIALTVVVRRLLAVAVPSQILGLKLRAFVLLHVFVLGYTLGVLL